MNDISSTIGFDYSLLPAGAADVARGAAATIRERGRLAAESIVAIGEELLKVKDALPHGAWTPWLDAEFGWTDRTARTFMRVASWAKSESVSDLGTVDLSALYLISARSTPAAVQTAALAIAETGERVTRGAVRGLIAAHGAVEAKGAAALRDAVEAGEVGLPEAARIAHLPKSAQREVVADIRSLAPVAPDPVDGHAPELPEPAAEILPPSADAQRALVRAMVEDAVARHTKARSRTAPDRAPVAADPPELSPEEEEAERKAFIEWLGPPEVFRAGAEVGGIIDEFDESPITAKPAAETVGLLTPSDAALYLPGARRVLAWITDLVAALEARCDA